MSGLEKALFNLKVSQIRRLSGFRYPRGHLKQSARKGWDPISYANLLSIQFTAKQLNRQAAKAGKDEKTEKDKLKKVGGPPHLTVNAPPISLRADTLP